MKATATTIIISRHLAISPIPSRWRTALVFHSSRKVLNDNTVKAPANEQGSGARSVTSKSASPKAEIEPLYSLSLHATLPPLFSMLAPRRFPPSPPHNPGQIFSLAVISCQRRQIARCRRAIEALRSWANNRLLDYITHARHKGGWT